MRLDPFPRFPADQSQLIRKLTDLFRAIAFDVEKCPQVDENNRINVGTDTTDDIVIDLATKGLVLKDTQGTPHYWRVTIDNTGALVTTDLGTTKP